MLDKKSKEGSDCEDFTISMKVVGDYHHFTKTTVTMICGCQIKS